MRLTRVAQRLTELSTAEWRILGSAFVRLWRARIELSLRPFATVYREHLDRAEGCGPRDTRRNMQATKASLSEAQITRLVGAASRLVFRPTCLVKAMAAHHLLRTEGYASTIRIGVQRNTDAQFGAHAWVEIDGRIVIGGQQSLGFAPLPSLDDVTRNATIRSAA